MKTLRQVKATPPTVHPSQFKILRRGKVQVAMQIKQAHQSQASGPTSFKKVLYLLCISVNKRICLAAQVAIMSVLAALEGLSYEDLQGPLFSTSLLGNALNAAGNKGRQPAQQGQRRGRRRPPCPWLTDSHPQAASGYWPARKQHARRVGEVTANPHGSFGGVNWTKLPSHPVLLAPTPLANRTKADGKGHISQEYSRTLICSSCYSSNDPWKQDQQPLPTDSSKTSPATSLTLLSSVPQICRMNSNTTNPRTCQVKAHFVTPNNCGLPEAVPSREGCAFL